MLDTDVAMERHALALLDHSLPKIAWTHAGHFAAALWLLRHRPELTEPGAIRAIISGYNEATGTPNTDTGGYHHTITLASLAVARAHLESFDGRPLHIALADLMASRLGHPDWLLAHWRRETLFSVAARRCWVFPDISPHPLFFTCV